VVVDRDGVGLRRDCVGAGRDGARAGRGDDRDGATAGALAGLDGGGGECVCVAWPSKRMGFVKHKFFAECLVIWHSIKTFFNLKL
jgi:hypothetical protein